MYALIENQKVIGVFDENDLIANNSWQTVVPIDENCLFWLTGGNVVVGKLINDNDYEGLGDWIVLSDQCEPFPLSEIQSWQPIGTWLSF